MSRKPTGSHRNGPPRQRQLQPKQKDPYLSRAKSAATLVCDACGVIGHAGRWLWMDPPATDVERGLCPACQRIRDRCPAGTLRVPNGALAGRDELVEALRSVEAAEMREHPLERILAIDVDGDALVITTTGQHIARCLSARLERRLHQKPKVHYGNDGDMRVEWAG